MLAEILFETHKEEYYRILKINVKKFRNQRIQGVVLFFLLWFIFAMFFTVVQGVTAKSLILLAILPLFVYMGWKYQYLRLMNLYKKRTYVLGMIFPEFLTSFISLLHSLSGGNVVSILEASAEYVEEPLKSELFVLTNRIKQNPDSESVYEAIMDLAKFVGTKEAGQVLMLLYEMYDGGINKDALAELERKIDRMNENKIKDVVTRKSAKLRMASFPAILLAGGFLLIWIGTVLTVKVVEALKGLNM